MLQTAMFSHDQREEDDFRSQEKMTDEQRSQKKAEDSMEARLNQSLVLEKALEDQ